VPENPVQPETQSLSTKLLSDSDETRNLWGAFSKKFEDKPINGSKSASGWGDFCKIEISEDAQPQELKLASAKILRIYQVIAHHLRTSKANVARLELELQEKIKKKLNEEFGKGKIPKTQLVNKIEAENFDIVRAIEYGKITVEFFEGLIKQFQFIADQITQCNIANAHEVKLG